MNRMTAIAALALLTCGLAEADAQVIFTTRPNRPTAAVTPFGYPYGYPYAFPYGYGYGLGGAFGSGTYSPPVTPAANAPGYTSGITGRTTQTGQGDQTGVVGQTGHPTRFLSYSHYFLNQSGSAGTAGTGAMAGARPGVPGGGILVGGDYARSPAGASPARPARSGGGTRR